MSDLGNWLYLMGGISGAFFLVLLLWGGAHHLLKDKTKPPLAEEKEPEDWDPFKHLGEISETESGASVASAAVPPSARMVPPSATVQPSLEGQTALPEAKAEGPEDPSDDPWKKLLQDTTPKSPKRLREIGLDSDFPSEGDKT